MKKVLTTTGIALVSGMLASAAPAAAGNFNAVFGADTNSTNSLVVQVRSNADQFSPRAFKRHFDGVARPQKRNLNQKNRRNGRGFGQRHGWGNSCVKPRRIHRRMVRQGWSDFHDLRIRRKNIRVKAYRNNGLLYNIKIHRCSGHIISTQLDWSSFQNIANYFDQNYFGQWRGYKRSAQR